MAGERVALRGGGFLIESPSPEEVFTPEDLDEQARLVAETARSFARQEVLPVLEALERGEHEHSVRLLRKAGELGLLAADVPAEYGGLGLPKTTSTLATEAMAAAASFSITFGGHVGIGTLPIVFFGTPGQKARYLPALASGEKIAAYALTEPDAGSDALGAKTRAVLTPDGKSYLLSGQKQWITNAGFADVFVVYAKVDGEKFSAFIVERGYPGLTVGPEVDKMGLQGSSTCALHFAEVPVPAENLLGEVGRGHVIAFNILNIGRWKLAAGCVGACKEVMQLAASYATQRRQFGKAIASFPLIQQKLARMAARTYALESMVYRTAGLLDASLGRIDLAAADAGEQAARAVGEYAVEASINKVFGSEALDLVVDEGVQIHGGYGYMREFAVERAYRDSRINRIFEGTNEINRLLIPATLLRRTTKGELPLMDAIGRLQQELSSLTLATPGESVPVGPLAAEGRLVDDARKICLLVAGLGAQKYLQRAEEEQEFLAAVADLTIETFALESALLRARKALERSGVDPRAREVPEPVARQVDLARLYIHEGFDRIEQVARAALAGIEEGDLLRAQLSVLRRLTRREPINGVALGRRVAAAVLQAEAYVA